MHPPKNDPAFPPYVDPNLGLYLTVSNLRGVPYCIAFKGNGYGHPMSLHKDHMHFFMGRNAPVFEQGDPSDDGWVWLNPQTKDAVDWENFRLAGLATGAFPLGLAHRVLKRPADDYWLRCWDVVKGVGSSGGSVVQTIQEGLIPPAGYADLECGGRWYEFVAVDGGLMDNEPLELARRALAGKELVNPRSAREANRAVVLIDPFPEPDVEACSAVDGYEELDILGVGMKMFSGLKNQARFKMEEIQLAQDKDCFSRFLLGPSRDDRFGSEPHIACGTLGGFGGFFHRPFRQHDYQLGRRNCQKFLQDYLVIPLVGRQGQPENDALHNDVFLRDRARLQAEVASAKPRFSREVNGERVVPIIPLTGTAHDEVKPVAWSQIAASRTKINGLKPLMQKRLAAITNIYLRKVIPCKPLAWVMNLFLKSKYGELSDMAVQKVLDDFEAANLVR
jgi:hypothetical protein